MAAVEAEDSGTCCTVETPSRLILFYPETTPVGLTAHLPPQPVCKPVGSQVTMGRSSGADIRLNDERMSRLYASLWHDGKDPFVFRVSNLSERKMLLVDGAMLRYKEEAEVKDGTDLILDFLQLKAKVCAGDYVAFSYQVAFVKNVVLSPPPPPPLAVSHIQPPDGKCLMPGSRGGCGGRDLSSVFSCGSAKSLSLDNKAEATGDVVSKLLTCLQTASLDSGMGQYSYNCSTNSGSSRQGTSLDSASGRPLNGFDFSSRPFLSQSRNRSLFPEEDVGVEYELPENLVSGGICSASDDAFRGAAGTSTPAASGCSCSCIGMSNTSALNTDHKFSMNIPPFPVINNSTGNKLFLNIPPPPDPDSTVAFHQRTASTASATPQCQQRYPFRLSCASPPPLAHPPPIPAEPVLPPSACPPQDNSHQQTPGAATAKKSASSSLWLNMDQASLSGPKPKLSRQQKVIDDSGGPTDLSQIAQRIQDSVIAAADLKAKPLQQGCPSCKSCSSSDGGGDVNGALGTSLTSKPEVTQPMMVLADMVVVSEAGGRRITPVENCEWDTDDPNINCYMD